MYNDDVLRIPVDEEDLWKVLQEHFVLVRDALEMPVETKEQAFDVEYQSSPQAKLARINGGIIRYRDVSEENNQRDYYLEMGIKLIPYVKNALKAQRLTPEFVQQWGKLMFCYGYIVSHIFDDSDDLALIRAGIRRGRQRSKDAQRKWIAHIMIPLIDSGIKRGQAENDVVGHVKAALDNEALRGGFPLPAQGQGTAPRIPRPRSLAGMAEASHRWWRASPLPELPSEVLGASVQDAEAALRDAAQRPSLVYIYLAGPGDRGGLGGADRGPREPDRDARALHASRPRRERRNRGAGPSLRQLARSGHRRPAVPRLRSGPSTVRRRALEPFPAQ